MRALKSSAGSLAHGGTTEFIFSNFVSAYCVPHDGALMLVRRHKPESEIMFYVSATIQGGRTVWADMSNPTATWQVEEKRKPMTKSAAEYLCRVAASYVRDLKMIPVTA